jgi:hypothetical protein
MQVVTRPTIYRPFFTRKTPGNAKLVEIQTTWHGTLNWSYKVMKKIGVISRMSRKNVLSDGGF